LSRRLLWVGATLLAAFLDPVWAQTGGLRVTVGEASDGGRLPGVTVTLTSSQGLIAPTTKLTDRDGVAEFPVLRSGTGYVVEATLPGYGSQRRPDLRVRSGRTLIVEILLAAPLEETVRVIGTESVINLQEVGSPTKFTDEFIQDLPQLGRLYQDVIPLAPGVLDHDGDGNPNVHGSRTRDFRAEVSGVSNVDPLTGQWMSYVNADSIEEMEVIPLGAGVEFGRAQGGFARVVQRQGTNQFEGVFNFLYRSSDLDGDGAGDFHALPNPDFQTLQPAIQLSGPILRDRLWYRLSHEYVRQEEPINLLGGLAVTTLEQTVNADQLTWQVSPRHKLAFQYQHDPLKLTNLGVSSSTPAESSHTFERGGDTFSLNWTAPLSERLLLDSIVAYQDHSHDIYPTDPAAYQDCLWFSTLNAVNQAQCRNLSTNRTSGPYPESSFDDRQRLTTRFQATWFRRLWGQSHQLKAGLVVENERYFRELTRDPTMTFTRVVPLFGNPYGVVDLTMPMPGVSESEATGNSWAVFVEDQWKPRDNLMLTLGLRLDPLGLRLDREEIDAHGMQTLDPEAEATNYFAMLNAGESISETLEASFTGHQDPAALQQQLADLMDLDENSVRQTAVFIQSRFWDRERWLDDINLANQNLAPRLTVAWDPWNDGKTKFALSAGRYYDKIFLAVPLVELEPVETRNTQTAWWHPLAKIFVNFETGVSLNPISARMIDRDLRTPYQDEYSLSFERELGQETSLRVSWVRRMFRDQLQDVDINHAPGDHGRCDAEEVPDISYESKFQGVVVPSEGEGQLITDPFSGEQYVDTDPGPGDGKLDDCVGRLVVPRQGLGALTIDIPDGRDDLYVQNPAWEELLLLGNFNRSDYEAFVVELIRRQFRNWQMQASYTWSEAVGNAEDFDLLLGNQQNLREDERGLLDYDQTHVVKFNGTFLASAGWRFGLGVQFNSGLPYSLLTAQTAGFNAPPAYPFQRTNAARSRVRYPTGQRNDQRNPAFWNVDLQIAKEFALSQRSVLRLSGEVFNVLNDDTLTVNSVTSNLIDGTRRFGRRFQLGARVTF